MKPTMSKIYALDVIDHDIKTELIHGNGISKEMARAIERVTTKLRKNLNARWGHALRNPNRNLSLLVESNIQPVLRKIILIDGQPTSSYLSFLNARSKPPDVAKAEVVIKRLCPLASPQEKAALDLLYGVLILLRAHFSPDPRRITKRGDADYCIFCYRDRLPGATTCHQHTGIGRTHGRYHHKKYQAIKGHLLRASNDDSNLSQFLLTKLKRLEVPQWSGKENDIEWIAKVLRAIDATSPRKITWLASYIADLSVQFNHPSIVSHWPSALNGTMFRYAAYELALIRTPSSKVATRLNEVWSSIPISAVAKQHGVSRQMLHRQVAKWAKEIKALRSEGLEDETIKLVFGLQLLPAN